MRVPVSTPPEQGVHGDLGREVAVARQPIYDRRLNVVGYELLFRDPGATEALVADAVRSTSSVIADVFSVIGLDAVVGDRPAYVKVSREFLLGVHPLPLRPDRVVLELTENGIVDAQLIDVLERLTAQGFTIALDDFVYDDSLRRLLELAGVVKLDVAALGLDGLEQQMTLVTPFRPTIVAKQIETHERFDACRELGCHRFQGHFFAKPRIMRGRAMPTRHIAALRSVTELHGADSLEDLRDIVARDVGLSYRLLRYINSAFFSLPRAISSIHEALVLLGARTVQRWAIVMALSGVEDKPDELLLTSLVRARMCELLSGSAGTPEGDEHFTVGLFSLADALLDTPMSVIIDQLPFAEDLAAALLRGDGPKGDVLRRVVAYERGDFDRAIATNSGTATVVAYRDAASWAHEAARALN